MNIEVITDAMTSPRAGFGSRVNLLIPGCFGGMPMNAVSRACVSHESARIQARISAPGIIATALTV
jgi:hypothetical protein